MLISHLKVCVPARAEAELRTARGVQPGPVPLIPGL
jgi:hypothetical protein